MPSIQDIWNEPENTPIHDALQAGVEVLSEDQQVTFVPYVKMILPIDGFVTWVSASLLTPTQLAQRGLQSKR